MFFSRQKQETEIKGLSEMGEIENTQKTKPEKALIFCLYLKPENEIPEKTQTDNYKDVIEKSKLFYFIF